MFYQPKDFTVLQDSYVIDFIDYKPSEKVYLYFITLMQKVIRHNYDWTNKAGWERIKNVQIYVPYNMANTIAFDFVEAYINELEEECIRELTSYLKASGLENYELTDEEKKILDNLDNIKYEQRKIDDFFFVNSSKKKFNANTINFDGKYPYVARGSSNNGIRGYITEDIKFLNVGKTISFGQDTATIYYQEKDYFTADKIKILSYKKGELLPELACYYISAMRKSFQNFSWGESSFNEKVIKNTEIYIPIKDDGTINYEFMEKFIKIQEKLVIKNVVLWKDKVIEKQKI